MAIVLAHGADCVDRERLMSAFVCEKCGGELRLSLVDRAYLCDKSPQDHRFDRGESEQAWVKEAANAVEAAPGDVDAVFALASLCGRLAATSIRAGDADPARAYMSQVVGVIEPLYAERKSDEKVRAMFMEALVEQASVSERLNDHAMAAAAYEKLLPIVQSLADADPKNIGTQRNLSTCLNSAGRMVRALGNGVAAAEYFGRDLALIERLVELYPENTDLLFDIAVAHFNLYLVSVDQEVDVKHLKTVVSTLSKLPDASRHEGVTKLERRAKEELDRITTTQRDASRLADATAKVAQHKEQQDSAPQSRQGLIDEVERVLKGRRERLSVVNERN